MSYRIRTCLFLATLAVLVSSTAATPGKAPAATFAVQDTFPYDSIRVFSTVHGVVGLPVTVTAAGLPPTLSVGRLLTLSQTNNAPFLTGPVTSGPSAAPTLTLTGIPDFTQSGTFTVNWSLTNDSIPPGTTTATTSLVIHNLIPPTGVRAYYTALPPNVPIRNASGVISYVVWDGSAPQADSFAWNGYRVRRTIHGISSAPWEVVGQYTDSVEIVQNQTPLTVKTPTSPICLSTTEPCVPDSFQFTGTGLFFRGFRDNSLGGGRYVLDYPPGAPVDECSQCWVFVDLGTISGFTIDYKVTSIGSSNRTDFIETPLNGSPTVTVTVGTPPAENLERVAVVPNPYKGHAEWDPAAGDGRIHFIHIPAGSTVRIFTTSAELVRELVLDSNRNPGGETGEVEWDLRNGKGNKVVSGIYVYQVETREGRTRKGHFVIIK